jgi:hypothetical protein
VLLAVSALRTTIILYSACSAAVVILLRSLRINLSAYAEELAQILTGLRTVFIQLNFAAQLISPTEHMRASAQAACAAVARQISDGDVLTKITDHFINVLSGLFMRMCLLPSYRRLIW